VKFRSLNNRVLTITAVTAGHFSSALFGLTEKVS
jgi:hypothetical protein